MTITFIELTRHISPRRGYATVPQFRAHIWPLLLRHADSIKETFLFFNSRWSGSKRSFEGGETISTNIVSVGSLEGLSPNGFKEIERRIEAGCFNVLFRIEPTSRMLPQLFDLWITHGKVVWGRSDDIGLKKDEAEELAKLLTSLSDADVIAAFDHEAEPCYLFGARETLEALLCEVRKQERIIYCLIP